MVIFPFESSTYFNHHIHDTSSMASLNPSFYPIATGACFSLLDLPTEILIKIATQVISVSEKRIDTDFTLFGHNNDALVSLSSVNRELRDICLAVGLFLTVRPILWHKQLKPSLTMGGPEYRQPRLAKLKVRTLVVDVSHKELWLMYWQVLGLFSKVDELRCVQRKCPRDRVLSKPTVSILSRSIMLFQGTSLVFSGCKMSRDSARRQSTR